MPRFYLEAKRAESALRLGVQCSPPEVRMDSSGIAVLQREADTPFLVDESDSSRHRERETGTDHTCRAMTKAIKRQKRRKPRMNKGLTASVSSRTEKGLAKLKESGAGNGLWVPEPPSSATTLSYNPLCTTFLGRDDCILSEK